ncbi:hypothetical protein [Persicitalea sp.]|uniref:hypothetical protein n=1 Tax=Persicitalea sp. TaxID=3100273 RepID=UPI0035940D65
MELTEQEYDQIEAYLSGRLTEVEMQEVEARAQADPEFRQKWQYQFGIRAFFQHRYDELRLLEVLDDQAEIETKTANPAERRRQFIAPYLKLVAMLVAGLGVGWLLFGRSGTGPQGELLLSRRADRTIFPNPENSFGDQDSVVSQVVIQAYANRDFSENSFTYRNDSLRLYNVPASIFNSVRLDLVYKNRAYRLQTDDQNYLLRETRPDGGVLEPAR